MTKHLLETTCSTPEGTWKLVVHEGGEWEFKYKPIDQLEQVRARGSVADTLAKNYSLNISDAPRQELKYLLQALQLLCQGANPCTTPTPQSA